MELSTLMLIRFVRLYFTVCMMFRDQMHKSVHFTDHFHVLTLFDAFHLRL